MIKKIRIERGLTIQELADKVGVSPRTIINIEKSKDLDSFRFGTVKKLCLALDLDIKEV